MGKGDKKTKKGKISTGSYGNSRPRHQNSKKEIRTTVSAEVQKTETPKSRKPASKSKKADQAS